MSIELRNPEPATGSSLWSRLFTLSISEGQPVGFGHCKDEPPQAEACTTSVTSPYLLQFL